MFDLSSIELLESTLQFDSLNTTDLHNLGMYLAEHARANRLPIVVDIEIGNLCLFRFSGEGTSLNTQRWAERKRNTVLVFGHSTAWVQSKLESKANLLEEKYGLDPSQHTIVPGSFPLLIRGLGMIGCVTVAGLKPEEDHDLVVHALRHFLPSKAR